MSGMFAASVLGLTAAISTYFGVGAFRRWAENRRLLDFPNARSSHSHPIPRGAGAVVAGAVLACGLLIAGTAGSRQAWTAFLGYASGGVLVAAVSWRDDVRSLPSWQRLAFQILAAAVAIAILGPWRVIALPLAGPLNLGMWGVLVTGLWIVGLTNAYNFMDGIDGIAGTQALVAGLGWAALGRAAGNPLVGGLGLSLAGASLGFLFHNWHPARIFMGDVGSAFIGYTLAVLPLMYSHFSADSTGALVVGVLLVWPFVFDTAFTFFRRAARGERVIAAHRSHLYQRLAPAPANHRGVALLYTGLALLGALLAQVWSTRAAAGEVTAALALPIPCLGLWWLATTRKPKPDCGAL